MRMSVSIFTSKAFSMRRAMSPDISALPFRRLERAGARHAKGDCGRCYGKACGLNNFGADEISGMRWVFYRCTVRCFHSRNRHFASRAVTILTPAEMAALRSFESVVASGRLKRNARAKCAAS